ncbi:MAG: inositol monophosphatase [Actinomycetota bacterium]|nr:inositol monophosphatase [Actinomycetota bacterium]
MTSIAAKEKTRATAHRGDSSNYRENTLAAIRSAITAGADLVEVDVRVTRDGHVVLLHDASLLRLWDLDRNISEVDYALVRGLGSGQERIPLLSEALELFRDSPSRLLIDMEDAAPAAAAAAVVLASGVDVSWCGNLDGMRRIRALDPAAPIWLPWSQGVAPPAELMAELMPEFVNSEYVVLNQGMVDRIHAMGARVACWTVDDPEAMRWILGLGVDSITTNQLDRLQITLTEESQAMTPSKLLPRLDGAETLEALTVARELAQWAIEFTRTADPGKVRTKAHPADLVTEVDVAVERHVRAVIERRFPHHNFVGEEMGGNARDGVPCWYLDPVDGTTNFANSIPWTAFSLALAIDRTPLVAVVGDPWRREIFEASAGQGARLNGVELTIPARNGQSDPLAGAAVLTELAGHLPWPGMIEFLDDLGRRHGILRIMGSATMTVVGIAAGRGAASVIGEFSPIDHLAGTLIVQEAGGIVLDSAGTPNAFPSGGGVVVSAREVADEVYLMWRAACEQNRTETGDTDA